MPSTLTTRTFVTGAPLAFAALLVLHPMGGADFHAGVAADSTRWLAVHFASAALFPLMALVVWRLICDVPGRARTVARTSLPVFAVFYGAWEAVMGIATGVLAREGTTMAAPAREGVAQAVNAIATHPLVGEAGVLGSIGGLAWAAAISAAIVALHGVGVRRSTLVLLGLGAVMVMHVPPFGPVALVCLGVAAARIQRERDRRSWRHAAVPVRAVAARA